MPKTTNVLIYHMTHYKNIPNIIESGLLCTSVLRQNGFEFENCANIEIQERRADKQVPIEPGGCVHDYVPFYFNPRSPMLYYLNKNQQGGQRYMIHLETHAKTAYSAGQCVFTDGHPIMALSEFYSDLKEITNIDWPLMGSQQWANTTDDPDRKRRRQAEFLVLESLPWTCIERIGVLNSKASAYIEKLIETAEHKPAISVEPNWYY